MLSDLQREGLLAELGGLRKFCISLTGSVADGDDLLQATVERVLEKACPRTPMSPSGPTGSARTPG